MKILKKGKGAIKNKLDIYNLKCFLCDTLFEFNHTECKSLIRHDLYVSNCTVSEYPAENRVGTVICPTCGCELIVKQSDYVKSVYVKI